jgi:plasmid stabilization system protein ParE
MNPRRLIVRDSALRDLLRHEHYLGAVRGTAFAEAWSEALLDWLENRAALGAQLGTAHPRHQATAPLASVDKQQYSPNSRMGHGCRPHSFRR